MKDDFTALTKSVIALAQSIENYVYEMSEHDEVTYDSRGEIVREDVDYMARGQDWHYIPMLEDEITNYYIPPPSQNQQGRYFDNTSSNLNFYSRQDDEEPDEPSLAQLMAQMITTQTQMIATQSQQGKDLQILMSELQLERAARKMLEMQFAQQASSSSQNPEEFPSQPDVILVDAKTILLKSGKVFEEPLGKERASTEVVNEDVQLEHIEEKEVVEQETPSMVPPAYIPPMHFPHRQIKVHVETTNDDKVIDVCQLTFFESKVLSNKHAKNSNTVWDNLSDVVKKSFHEGPEILICNTRLKDETTMSLPGH